MKRYYVTVNGKKYAVEVEEVKGDFAQEEVTIPKAKTQIIEEVAPAVEVKKEEVKQEVTKKEASPVEPSKVATAGGQGEPMECPMPGTILKVNVTPGTSMKKGDVILVLEAMKMENEIMAPKDCKIVSVNVVKGSVVNTGDILVTIE